MTIVTRKTVSDHQTYLFEIVRLKLHFVHHWLSEHPEEDFISTLRNRVDIYRKTNVNPGAMNPSDIDWKTAAWLDMEQSAKKNFPKIYKL